MFKKRNPSLREFNLFGKRLSVFWSIKRFEVVRQRFMPITIDKIRVLCHTYEHSLEDLWSILYLVVHNIFAQYDRSTSYANYHSFDDDKER